MSEASDPYGTQAFWARKQARDAAAMGEDGGDSEPETQRVLTSHLPDQRRPVLRDEKGRILPGGPTLNPLGRSGKKGGDVRQQLGRAFLTDLHDAWEDRGAQVLRRLAVEDPAAFATLVARVLPKEIRLTDERQGVLAEMGLDALAALRDELREAVALARRGVPVQIPSSLEALTHGEGTGEGRGDPDPEGSGS